MSRLNCRRITGVVMIVLGCQFRSCHSFSERSFASLILRKNPPSINALRYEISAPSVGRLPAIHAKKNGNDNDEQPVERKNFLPVAVFAVAFVSFWPLLALLRATNDPTSGFDVDMFMALKGILDGGRTMDFEDIVELPPLSPAEQLVGAIFGPP